MYVKVGCVEIMLKSQLTVLTVSAAMVFTAVAPTHAQSPSTPKFNVSPTASPKPTSSPTVKPTVKPKPSVTYYCAYKSSGQAYVMQGNHCAPQSLFLGAGPLVRGSKRPNQLDPLLSNRLRAAQIAARKLNFSIGVTSGWRSLNEQQRLFRRAVKQYGSVRAASRWALPPEKSQHPWGLALDLHFSSKAASRWFDRYSSSFGLCRTYRNEWWHYEPVIAPMQRCPKLKANAG